MTTYSSTPSCVYGPVYSWRFGRSLGIDPICSTSACSFHCIYCQLGCIQKPLVKRRIFVTAEEVLRDFKIATANKTDFDTITFSGSGEPTLAANIGHICSTLKAHTSKQMTLLTNGTLLYHRNLHKELVNFDHVVVKLDAGDKVTWQKINRPVSCLDFATHIRGLEDFRTHFPGVFSLQIMAMPANTKSIYDAIPLIKELSPANIYLCAPTRPVPTEWKVKYRGDHTCEPARTYDKMKYPGENELNHIVAELRSYTGAKVHLAPRAVSPLRRPLEATEKGISHDLNRSSHEPSAAEARA